MKNKKIQNLIKIVISFFVSTLGMMAYIYSTRSGILYPEYVSVAIGFTPLDLLVLCCIAWQVYIYINAKKQFNIFPLIAAMLFAYVSIYMRELFLPGTQARLLADAPLFFALIIIGFTLIYYVFIELLTREKHRLNLNINSLIASVFSIVFIIAYRYTHRDDISGIINYLKSITLFEVMIVYIAYHMYYNYICTRFKFRPLFIATGFVLAFSNLILNDTYKHNKFFYSLINEPIVYVVTILIYTLSFYAVISYIMAHVELNIDGSSKPKNIFLMALKILILWTPIYLIFFPGAVSWESSWTINYTLNIGTPREFAPAFYQLFISLFVKIGQLLQNDTLGVVIYFAFVGYMSALAMAMIIHRAAKLNLSRGVMQFISIFCIANPFIILKTFTMQYDSLLGIALLYFSILLYDILAQGVKFINFKNIVLLFISGFAVCAFRNVGKLLVIVAAISLFVFGYKKVGKKILLSTISLLLAVITFTLGNSALKSNLGYAENDKLANFAMPLQQMSYVISKRGVEALSDDEKEKLSSFIDPELFRLRRNSNKIDELKYEMESYWEYKTLSEDNFQKLKSVWLSMMKRYPIDYIKAFVDSSYLYFIPGHFEDYRIFGHYNHQIYHSRDSHSNMQHTLYYMGIDRARAIAKDSALLGFVTPFGLYMSAGLIQLFNLFVFAFARQRRVPKFLLMPTIVYGLGTVLSPINGWIRYMTPAGFVVPLLMLYILYAIKTDRSRGNITLHFDEY